MASAPCSPRNGVGQVDNREMLSGIIHVMQKGLRWMDAPTADGPHKTLDNRCRRW